MPSDNLAIAWKDAFNVAPVSERLLRLDVKRLRRGVFVTELDRPWQDTPFLIQGFLVDSDIELKTLQRYCRYVFVDLDRSDPKVAVIVGAAGQIVTGVARTETPEIGAFPHEPGVQFVRGKSVPLHPVAGDAPDEPRDEEAATDTVEAETTASAPIVASPPTPGAGRVYRVRADVSISRETRQRFRSLMRAAAPATAPREDDNSLAQRALARMRGLFGSASETDARGDDEAAARAVPAEVSRLLAPGTRTRFYQDHHDAAAELARAREVFAHADGTLSSLAGDIRACRAPRLDLVSDAVERMVDSICDNPDALLWVVQMREENALAYQQGVRVALCLVTFGRQLGLPKAQLNTLGMIGMLADVGKARLPRALLDKPGMLNPAEYSIVKEHVRLGLEALSIGKPLARDLELGIAQHHERLDGSGYPKGLKGDEITLFGRMAAIADCFAALSAPRAYANPLAAQDALMSMYQWADTSFQGVLVEQFVQAIGVFPVGSLIELSSGEIAVVVAHNRLHRLEPKVLLLTWPDKRALPTPIEIDLLHQTPVAGAKPLRVMRGLPSGAYGLKLRDYYAESSGVPKSSH